MQHDRTGFYPVCAGDHIEPLRLLKGHVDRLVFCDIRKLPMGRTSHREIMDAVHEEELPQPAFISGDALDTIAMLKPVDLFFIRRDTGGEGGSGLYLLGAERLPMVLDMIKPGGTLVTDRICGGEWFREFMSDGREEMYVGNRVISMSHVQPWSGDKLRAFSVS